MATAMASAVIHSVFYPTAPAFCMESSDTDKNEPDEIDAVIDDILQESPRAKRARTRSMLMRVNEFPGQSLRVDAGFLLCVWSGFTIKRSIWAK